jgi:hypothetical protein
LREKEEEEEEEEEDKCSKGLMRVREPEEVILARKAMSHSPWPLPNELTSSVTVLMPSYSLVCKLNSSKK